MDPTDLGLGGGGGGENVRPAAASGGLGAGAGGGKAAPSGGVGMVISSIPTPPSIPTPLIWSFGHTRCIIYVSLVILPNQRQ